METGQGKFMFKPMLLMKAVFNLQEERSWTPFGRGAGAPSGIEISPLSSFNTACVSGRERKKPVFMRSNGENAWTTQASRISTSKDLQPLRWPKSKVITGTIYFT